MSFAARLLETYEEVFGKAPEVSPTNPAPASETDPVSHRFADTLPAPPPDFDA